MNRSRATTFIALASLLAVGGCGGDEAAKIDKSADQAKAATPTNEPVSEPTPEPAPDLLRASLRDPAGDPEDGNYGKHPDRGDLDIRRVGIAQTDDGVRVVATLAKPPSADNIYGFLACDDTGNGCSSIEVRRDLDGTLNTTWYSLEDIQVEPLDGAAEFKGSVLTVEIPTHALVTPPPFEWKLSVATRTSQPEISDQAPNQPDGIDIKMARLG